ncbi:hypothetical protein FRACYDRAFT_235112 [Fragilariopsis cylindrus CCMP1102]|uniref:Uncharacterized protein n=1 Tax=Fragilariopsis cylindrus CCMP1102 TaxID=635003 RepID=A0A1E7FTK8_9STRA|nr:hypothetical protein FRACYDRAFT_235112 [Fragilariopsis cylindrus CCMP1102]|eukprot:OEU21486.1 hypothetical protein FRACYDRAFT_235112 [Fragilariopsis cylindrus CCMP1102]
MIGLAKLISYTHSTCMRPEIIAIGIMLLVWREQSVEQEMVQKHGQNSLSICGGSWELNLARVEALEEMNQGASTGVGGVSKALVLIQGEFRPYGNFLSRAYRALKFLVPSVPQNAALSRNAPLAKDKRKQNRRRIEKHRLLKEVNKSGTSKLMEEKRQNNDLPLKIQQSKTRKFL